MKNQITERLAKLRALMKEKGIDVYLIPTDDFHASEYVGEHFKCRKYMTGFTGSAGTAVITQQMAGMWTDGRYFIQAEQQMEGTTVELFKIGEPGVPSVHEFLAQTLKEGQCLGFDGRTVSAEEAKQLAAQLKGVRISCDEDLVGQIWTGRPALSCKPVKELDAKWTGQTRAERCGLIRKAMEEKGADAFVLTSLDDIVWLLNIRGGDVKNNPVVLSYLIMKKDGISLFANEKAFPQEVIDALAADGVKLYPYDDIYTQVQNFRSGEKVLLCTKKVNYRLVNNIPEGVQILDEENLTTMPKAIKTPTEVEHERIAHIKDGAALTKFIFWLKKNVGKEKITELSAAEKLYEFRSEQENFMGNSFEPIISYGAHAAMNHYSATPETDVEFRAEGLLLADTGGQYLEGTTDTTRTIVLGTVTGEQKKFFTAVLRGTLNLAAARFKYGVSGLNLDYLARQGLWELGADFNHGTGHGVGYYLNVHEGPNSFNWKSSAMRKSDTVFEEGMITSDEPGYYVEGEYGIRHENMIVCRKAEKTAFGQFMCFEHLTMVPFDLEGIIPEQFSDRERDLLNSYHAEVYRKISPYLNEEEKEWLKEATRAI